MFIKDLNGEKTFDVRVYMLIILCRVFNALSEYITIFIIGYELTELGPCE